jgi:hypothetical protein
MPVISITASRSHPLQKQAGGYLASLSGFSLNSRRAF